MRFTTALSCGAAVALAGRGPVYAQDIAPHQFSAITAQQQLPAEGESDLQEVVVTGYRQSLELAQKKKRDATQVIDSIVADDIGKLPDTNAAEALQRVPGVQVGSDLGEGSAVVIRGLSQVETLLNGRETFSAAGTRTLDFEFIPSELLSNIDVYKTQSADLIEGGLGGTIDVRTRRPFDFKGFTADASALGNVGDLAGEVKPQLSALLSDRWETGVGEVGALVSGSYQDRALQEDYISAGAPTCYGPLAGTVCTSRTIGPNGFYNPQYTADRTRTGLNAVLQWRVDSRLEFYLDAYYVKFQTPQLDYGTYPLPDSALARSATSFYPGTDIIESATYLDQPMNTLSINRLQVDTNQQVAAGADWHAGRLALLMDLSYLDTRETLDYHELDLQTTLPTFSINTSTSPPSESYAGVNLSNIANYSFAGLTDSVNLWSGRETALQISASYDFDWGPLTTLDFGARYANLADGLTPVRYFNPLADGPASAYPSLIQAYPLGNPFSGSSAATIGNYLLVNPAALQNIDGIISTLGLGGDPAVQNQGIYSIGEQDSAAYFKANFTGPAAKLTGKLGLRLVHTAEDLTGTETISGPTSVYRPIEVTNGYTDLLPSLNVRAALTDALLLRGAVYESLTRPEFSNLNPGLTLVPGNLTGSQGNPHLAPFKAVNYDATVEWYFAATSSVSADFFYKKVKGFPFTEGTDQLIDGASYIVSQPINSGSGKVQGMEASYQQLYTQLPWPLGGLGLQTNLTFIDSSAPTSVSGYTAPLPNLSKWSYNIVGIYEQGPWSARIAYFWRSQFLQSIAVASGVGVVPVESMAFGNLAAALNYRASRQFTLTLEGTNLTQARHQVFIGSVLSPNATYIDDRQFLAGVRYRF